MNRRVLRSAAAVLALVCATSGAIAGPKGKAFKATLDIAEVITPVGTPPCVLIGALTGSGTSTLGPVSGTSKDCINPLSASPTGPFIFVSLLGNEGLKLDFGDKLGVLYGVYGGTLTPQADGSSDISGYFLVTGGTGKFRGASGGGTLDGAESLYTGRGTITFNGTLLY